MKRLIAFLQSSALIIYIGIALMLGGCTTTQKIVSVKKHPHEYQHNKANVYKSYLSTNLNSTQKKIITEAMTWLGTPYEYANAEKGKGADCSGMVMKVFEKSLNYKIPRNSARQADFCDEIKIEKIKTGDLVFFATGKNPQRISHVGIMLNKEDFIHCSTSKGVVVSNISSPYYSKRLLKIGRLPNIKAYK